MAWGSEFACFFQVGGGVFGGEEEERAGKMGGHRIQAYPDGFL